MKNNSDVLNSVSPFSQETVEKLRETLRQLEVEFEVQRKSKKDLEELKEGLSTELTFLR